MGLTSKIGQTSALTLGWRVSEGGDPAYWLRPEAKPGQQKLSDLVCVPAAVMASHSIIIAQSGSGKSFFLGRLIEELMLCSQARCIILDPNADFRQAAQVAAPSLWIEAKYDLERRAGMLPHESLVTEFSEPWNKLGKCVLSRREGRMPDGVTKMLQLWWPDLSVEYFLQDLDPILRNQLIHCHTVVKHLQHLLDMRAKVKSGSNDVLEIAEDLLSIAIDDRDSEAFARRLKDEFDIAKLAELASTAVEEFQQSPSQWRSQLGMLVQNISVITRYISKEVASFYFGRARELRTLGLIGDKPPQNLQKRLTVVDLPSLENRRTRELVASDVIEQVWNRARAEWVQALDAPFEQDCRVPTFIVVDEAHNMIGQEVRSGLAGALREQFRTIAAEGRKYGVFLIMVSQRPDKLDPLVVSECQNRALMRLGSEAVLEITRRLLGIDDVPQNIVRKCLEFGVGRALLLGNWADGGAKFLYAAARRTLEGGRNLRTQHWVQVAAD